MKLKNEKKRLQCKLKKLIETDKAQHYPLTEQMKKMNSDSIIIGTQRKKLCKQASQTYNQYLMRQLKSYHFQKKRTANIFPNILHFQTI